MKTDVQVCSPEDPIFRAAETMRDTNVGFIPICDQSRAVRGTLTDRDITVRVVAEQRSFETTCGEVMTKNAVTCRPEDSLRDALNQMKQHRVARILCVDDRGSLVGVISLSDIAQRESNRKVADTMRTVTEREAVRH